MVKHKLLQTSNFVISFDISFCNVDDGAAEMSPRECHSFWYHLRWLRVRLQGARFHSLHSMNHVMCKKALFLRFQFYSPNGSCQKINHSFQSRILCWLYNTNILIWVHLNWKWLNAKNCCTYFLIHSQLI